MEAWSVLWNYDSLLDQLRWEFIGCVPRCFYKSQVPGLLISAPFFQRIAKEDSSTAPFSITDDSQRAPQAPYYFFKKVKK